MEKGNPDFNLTGVEPTQVLGAITDEDLELERMLQRAHEDEMPPLPIDQGPEITVRPEKIHLELLSDVEPGIKPASTIRELEDQVHLAKELGCDSIEATPALVRSFNRKHYPDDVGYFIYHNIKVYIEGFHKSVSKRDKESIEARLFRDSKIVGQPIMISEKK